MNCCLCNLLIRSF